ncbi:MAG: glycerophosphodiester phosphodiesterase family protein [Haliscomenobacter sp.]|nr:glycerophosphodiester phosphodiesterase family protein [Haliscomenobacter sp.]
MRLQTALLILLLPSFLAAQNAPYHTKIAKNQLPFLLKPGSAIMPLISAHRGGRFYPGLPENSLAVFKYTLQHTPAMLECDISLTKDSALYILHDNSLDRTTTCSGPIQDWTSKQLKACRLEDDFGKRTTEKIPSLKEVLKWAKGKAILSLDVKRGVPFEKVVEMVEKTGMEDYVVVITYNVKDALLVHQLNPRLMLSVSIRNAEEWSWYRESEIPFDRMVAFTGTVESPAGHYHALHEQKIPVILGTLGNLDKQAEAKGPHMYREWVKNGVDILATDKPVEVRKALNGAN